MLSFFLKDFISPNHHWAFLLFVRALAQSWIHTPAAPLLCYFSVHFVPLRFIELAQTAAMHKIRAALCASSREMLLRRSEGCDSARVNMCVYNRGRGMRGFQTEEIRGTVLIFFSSERVRTTSEVVKVLNCHNL